MLLSVKKTAWAAMALAAVFVLGGCGFGGKEEPAPTKPAPIVLPTAPTEAETAPPNAGIRELTVVMEAGDLYTLERYPDLERVDLSGSTCYGAILVFMENNPHLEVTFTVDLGGTPVDADVETVTLEPGRYRFAELLENLQYLQKLTRLSLPGMTLEAEQVHALLEAYPGIALDYTLELFGTTVGSDTRELDLSGMTSGQLQEACGKLGVMASLETVTLSSDLSKEDVDALQAAAPHIVFDYPFSLFGRTISTADEEIIYKNENIGNEGEAEIREALKILDNCKRFVLDNCKLDYEVLARIREDFRDGPKVVWRVYFGVNGRYNLLTDADTLRAVYNVTDDTCGPMKYCEDVKYMDIGHNEYLTDLSFLGYMKDIEVVIASGCAAKELVGIENCKKLTWLELAYCYKLENIENLSACESLRFLNLSHTNVKSFASLESLPLERFVCLRPRASTEEQNAFLEMHPKGACITVFYGYSNPYGYGWRYDDNGKTFNEYYKSVVRKAFNYDLLETYLPKGD